jgi:hypothetical protein
VGSPVAGSSHPADWEYTAFVYVNEFEDSTYSLSGSTPPPPTNGPDRNASGLALPYGAKGISTTAFPFVSTWTHSNPAASSAKAPNNADMRTHKVKNTENIFIVFFYIYYP